MTRLVLAAAAGGCGPARSTGFIAGARRPARLAGLAVAVLLASAAVAAAQGGGPEAEIDFSLWALFARATLTVKIVMLMLVVASFWAWAIIVQKHLVYRRARAEAAAFDSAFWSGELLDDLFDRIGPDPAAAPGRVFAAGMTEWRRSHRQDGGLIAGAQARIDRSMDVAIAKEAEALTSGLPFLATVGSTAPFVGLFGTVWGIKVAFEDIAIAQNTNLAVVAPGIAEALLATGLGLLAAIPAVVFYNKLTADSDRIIASYEAFADEFATILSRQLDAA
jgi:biopolymer transport protein TolQ